MQGVKRVARRLVAGPESFSGGPPDDQGATGASGAGRRVERGGCRAWTRATLSLQTEQLLKRQLSHQGWKLIQGSLAARANGQDFVLHALR